MQMTFGCCACYKIIKVLMTINDLIHKTNAYTSQNTLADIAQVDRYARKILDDIANMLKPGISESQATVAAEQIFNDYGIEKLWHRPLIRFHQNTLCTFRDRPTTDYILLEVDIGIVKDGIEGDVGKTIAFGDNPEFKHLQTTSELLFQEATRYWQDENPTGIKLYEFVHAKTKEHGVLFNLSPAGHLIGAFPHTHAWTKGANTYPEKLSAGGWILEIQIKSLTQPFGAFYEGLLA
jgi:Xaa-Pro aminopeptidase